MKTEQVDVSYRDKSTNANVSLGKLDLEIPETVDEAVKLFSADGKNGEEELLDYAIKAYIIDRQRQYRDANRPDRPKQTSMLAKFKQLSPEKQEELLKAAGITAAGQ